MRRMEKEIGEPKNSPNSTIKLTDEEGKIIAKALSAQHNGFKDSVNSYWFTDKKYGSTYLGRNYEEALHSRNRLWDRFKKK